MKINHNVNGTQENAFGSVQGRTLAEVKDALKEQEKNKDRKSMNFFMGDLHIGPGQDRVSEERRKAREMAQKMLKLADQQDSEMRGQIDEHNKRGAELRDMPTETKIAIENVKEKLEALKDADESDPEIAGRKQALQDELTELRKQKGIEDGEMRAEYAMARGLKKELDNNNDMLDAKEMGDDLMEAAEKNVIGIIMEETKNKIDQDAADIREQAEEKKEEKEEQEEKIEAARERREEAADRAKDDMEDILELQQEQQKVQDMQPGGNLPDMKKTMDQAVAELKVTADDMKGLMVDKEV